MRKKRIKWHALKEEDPITVRGGLLDRVLLNDHFWITLGPYSLVFLGITFVYANRLLGIIIIGLGVFFMYKTFKKRKTAKGMLF